MTRPLLTTGTIGRMQAQQARVVVELARERSVGGDTWTVAGAVGGLYELETTSTIGTITGYVYLSKGKTVTTDNGTFVTDDEWKFTGLPDVITGGLAEQRTITSTADGRSFRVTAVNEMVGYVTATLEVR